jgi:hypothetical protein
VADRLVDDKEFRKNIGILAKEYSEKYNPKSVSAEFFNTIKEKYHEKVI